MDRNLFICSTVYQLLVALQIKITKFPDTESDLIITNEIPSVERIKELLSTQNLFGKIICVEGKNTALAAGKSIYFDHAYCSVLLEKTSGHPKDWLEKGRYTRILFSNIGSLNMRLAIFFRRRSPKAKIGMFEDGVSTYSQLYGRAFAVPQGNPVAKLRYRFIFDILTRVSELYVFAPELLVWQPKAAVEKIPPISEAADKLREVVNTVFDYPNLQDTYEEKVIFFEESYVADGDMVDDIAVVEKLKDKFGKENIFVKSHPRNPTNRFQEMGYKTNRDRAIPWEVIALNIPLAEKVLVSMSSTAVVSSYLLMRAPAKMTLAYQTLPIDTDRLKYTVEVIQRLEQLYPDAFVKLNDL